VVLRVEHVIAAVGDRLGVTPTEIRGPKRLRPLTYARHIAMYLVRELLPDYSYPMIAKEFGDRNHTSVISAYEKIRDGLLSDALLLEHVTELRRQLTEGDF
jgi:chromosomal replication initiator protein